LYIDFTSQGKTIYKNMENRVMAMLSVILLIFCGLVVLAALGVGTFFALLKLGVIVREASRPTIQDYGDYSLDQGREVRPEEERR
jgi:hypothetical protein